MKVMINKKKIEEAAKNFCESLEDERKAIQQAELDKGAKTAYTFIRPEVVFKAGINWFKENLWHDASEEPKKDELVLTDTRSIANKEHICWQAVKLSDNGFIRNWSNYVKATKITRWLYMEDLMKGGK